MVFFNCNACGEALKKNQVEKHLLRCRQCQALSCVDCGKDFWGNDYQNHTKCMTEDEKYCGKSYVPKVNKGEAKQEQWIEKVQGAIEKSASNPKLKGLLERLKDYPNIPRKKAKFENFLKNSLRVLSQPLIAQVWETLMTATGQNQGNGQTAAGQNDKPLNGSLAKNGNDTTLSTAALGDSEVPTVNSSEPIDQKISKRDRKEKRRQETSKKEKKDKIIEIKQEEEENKGKKRRFSETENDIQTETVLGDSSDMPEKKKKKKKKKQQPVEEDENSESVVDGSSINRTTLGKVNAEDESNGPVNKKKKMKFDWKATILAVLKSKGELSLKRLRRKVLQEFSTQDAANYSEENLNAKFEKKVKKMSGIKIQNDRVRLK